MYVIPSARLSHGLTKTTEAVSDFKDTASIIVITFLDILQIF
jgi:hypothetical protein